MEAQLGDTSANLRRGLNPSQQQQEERERERFLAEAHAPQAPSTYLIGTPTASPAEPPARVMARRGSAFTTKAVEKGYWKESGEYFLTWFIKRGSNTHYYCVTGFTGVAPDVEIASHRADLTETEAKTLNAKEVPNSVQRVLLERLQAANRADFLPDYDQWQEYLHPRSQRSALKYRCRLCKDECRTYPGFGASVDRMEQHLIPSC